MACFVFCVSFYVSLSEKVQVGKDQEKAQSERDSHSKNRGESNNFMYTIYNSVQSM